MIKSVLGLRQFFPRGLNKITGEWALAYLAWSLKRMADARLGLSIMYEFLQGKGGQLNFRFFAH